MRNRNSHRNVIVIEKVVEIVIERVIVKVIEIVIVIKKSNRNNKTIKNKSKIVLCDQIDGRF